MGLGFQAVRYEDLFSFISNMYKVSCQEAVQIFTQSTSTCVSSKQVLNKPSPKAALILQHAQTNK